MSASVRRRVFRRAAAAWQAGKPHKAWEIVQTEGLGQYWSEFQRVAFRTARRRFTARMESYR